MNPLYIDARDYIQSQGEKVTTKSLNDAMNLLASNPQLRPSAVKAGGGAAGIAAGLGAPTDQIISTPLAPPASQRITQTPLPPPVSPSPTSDGASSGKKTAGGTSASGKTVKDVPGGVGNYATAGRQDGPNNYGITPPEPTQMGGYTPPTPGSSTPSAPTTPPSAPSSPVEATPAGTGADDPGFLAHLMGGDYNGRVAASAGGLAAILGALLMSRGGSGTSARPRAGVPDPLAGAAPYGTPAVMHPQAPNQSPVPYSGEAPQTMPPQLAAIIEDAINGKPNNNIIGTRRGTQKPYSGEVPPGVQSGIPDQIMQLLGRQ